MPTQFTAGERAPIPTGWERGWIGPTVEQNAVASQKISTCTRILTLYFLSTLHVSMFLLPRSQVLTLSLYQHKTW
jgi:hypothetical protein